MLHRKSEEIDEEGNVIGGELKKKCDSFIACLEEFEDQYLSDRFNLGTVSGKDQQHTLNSFKKWLDRTNQQYSAERKQGDNYLAELRQYRGQIKFCCDQAERRQMDQAKINRFMEIMSADYVKKCNAINAANAKIVEENNREDTLYNTQLAAYHTQLALYNLKKGTGIMPIPPIPPVHKKLLPLPSGPSVPSRMTDELFNKICDVVESKSRVTPISVSYDAGVKCTKYIAPMLRMALNYCDGLIRENDLNDPQQILNWFMKKANQESDPNIAWYLKWICPYGKMGFPVFDDKSVMADIYYTCASNPSKAFKDVMSKFKEGSGGSSSTKKWVDKVVKSLAKSSSINEKTYEKFLDKCLDNMAESLRIKAPMSISRRPAIKQKPVKEKLEAMVKKILDAKRNIPRFPRNV